MMDMKIQVKYAGLYRLQVLSEKLEVVKDTGWFDNLITNQGLDFIGLPVNYNTSFGAPYLNTHACVGTGNTPPAFSDTQLTTFLAMYPPSTGSNVEGGTLAYVIGPPNYWSCVWQYTFPAGTATGNLTEVGVGNTAQTDTQPRVFSHALILDSFNNPTTLTVLSTESLVLTYELRCYLDLTDNTYSISISGISYTGTYRRAVITTIPQLFFAVTTGILGNSDPNMLVTNGSIGPVTGIPSGINATSDGNSQLAYINGTYYRQFTNSFSTGAGNVPGGISAVQIRNTYNLGSYQFSVSPVIPKTSSYQLTLTYTYSWSRYP